MIAIRTMRNVFLLLAVLLTVFGCDQRPQEIEVIVRPPAPKQYEIFQFTNSGRLESQQFSTSPKDLLNADAIEIRLDAAVTPYFFLEKAPIECVGMRFKSFSLRLVVPGHPNTIEIDIAGQSDWVDVEEAETGREVPTQNCALVTFVEHDEMVIRTGLKNSPVDGKRRTASLGIHKALSFDVVRKAIVILKASGFERFCFRRIQ